MSDPTAETRRLIDIMAALRDPQSGCPWDIEQDFASIAPYTIEEAYEVADAIARRDFSASTSTTVPGTSLTGPAPPATAGLFRC